MVAAITLLSHRDESVMIEMDNSVIDDDLQDFPA